MEAPEMMPMQEAAQLAHKRVFHRAIQASDEAMDVIATTLSRHLVVYGIQNGAAERRALSSDELAAGLFRAAGTRFDFRNEQLSISHLAVRKSELERTLELLAI